MKLPERWTRSFSSSSPSLPLRYLAQSSVYTTNLTVPLAGAILVPVHDDAPNEALLDTIMDYSWLLGRPINASWW
jgi:hypothetical protein